MLTETSAKQRSFPGLRALLACLLESAIAQNLEPSRDELCCPFFLADVSEANLVETNCSAFRLRASAAIANCFLLVSQRCGRPAPFPFPPPSFPAMNIGCNCLGVAAASKRPVKRYNLLVPDVFPKKEPAFDTAVDAATERQYKRVFEYLEKMPSRVPKVGWQSAILYNTEISSKLLTRC